MEMMKSCAMSGCFAQHQSHGDMEMNTEETNQNHTINAKIKTS